MLFRSEVYNDAGSVTLDKAFQGTKVVSRQLAPSKPTVLNLSLSTINNLLIVSPPKEFKQTETDDDRKKNIIIGDMLQVDFLKQDFLKNALVQNFWGDDPLSAKLLDQSFLMNIFQVKLLWDVK